MLAGSVALVGCGKGDAPTGSGSQSWSQDSSSGATGSISLELTTPQGVTFTGFSYAIVGPSFTKGGTLDVSHSTTISALIDDLPPGAGYTMTLMGTAAAPNQATCTGSSPFSVTAGQVTDVSVTLACHLQQQQPPPPPAPGVPVPPYAPVALGFALLALGTFAMGRRRAAV